jgi:hypothetical protein
LCPAAQDARRWQESARKGLARGPRREHTQDQSFWGEVDLLGRQVVPPGIVVAEARARVGLEPVTQSGGAVPFRRARAAPAATRAYRKCQVKVVSSSSVMVSRRASCTGQRRSKGPDTQARRSPSHTHPRTPLAHPSHTPRAPSHTVTPTCKESWRACLAQPWRRAALASPETKCCQKAREQARPHDPLRLGSAQLWRGDGRRALVAHSAAHWRSQTVFCVRTWAQVLLTCVAWDAEVSRRRHRSRHRRRRRHRSRHRRRSRGWERDASGVG